MKKLLMALALLGFAAGAWAACTSTVLTGPDGRTILCVACCDDQGRNCVTTCN